MKKIRINLYSSEFKPKKVILSLPQMIVIWIVVGILMISLALYSVNKRVALEKEYAELNNQLSEKQLILSELQGRVDGQVLDKSLERKLVALKNTEETKRTLLDIVNKKNILKSNGYAGFFEGLAQINVSGVSVQNINLTEHYVDILGVARDSDLVPRWVGEFSKNDYLSQFSFGSIRTSYDEENKLHKFSLTKENPDAKKTEPANKKDNNSGILEDEGSENTEENNETNNEQSVEASQE